MKYLPINVLKPHPRNSEIYKEIDPGEMEELVLSIKKYGIKHPVIINKDNLILSGHRRWTAAKKLKAEKIPVKIESFKDKDDELLFLILSNQFKSKTNEQKIREGILLEEIEKRSKEKEQTEVIIDEPDEDERPRDRIGKKIGMSGRTYEKGKKVVDKIDKLEKAGKTKEAEKLRETMSKNIDRASKIASGKQVPVREKKNKKVTSFTYWDHLADMISFMRLKKDHIIREYLGKTFPKGFDNFLGGVEAMIDQIRSWEPDKFVVCPKCKGKNEVVVPPKNTKMTCPWCFGGKTGLYRGMNDE